MEPVVVNRSSSSGPAMLAILAVVVIFAVALFVWQPWNTSPNKTTIINQQPAGSAQQGGTSGTSGTSGSSSGTSSNGH